MSFTSHFQSLYKHAIRVSSSFKNYLLSVISNGVKQAGTRLSRRHIKVSKVAEGLQKAKVLVNWGPFYNIFSKKVSQCRKKLKYGPFGIFQHPFSRKFQCLTMPKKLKGGTLYSRPVLYATRKKSKTFFVQFCGPTGTFWRHPKVL